MFVITVPTIVLLFNLPFSFKHVPHMARTWSPSTMLPFSSEAISRSASPSKESPTSAPVSKTSLWISSGLVEPQFTFIFIPLGSLWITYTCAPNSWRSSGAALYVAPFPQSTATLSPFKSISNVLFKKSIYFLNGFSTCIFLPKSPETGWNSISKLLSIYSSMEFSISSVSFSPFSLKNFIPLYSIGLWDAVIITPPSALSILIIHATAGVGSTPRYNTSIPAEFSPEDSAPSSISPDILVSMPTTILGLFLPFVKKYPPTRPNLYANSGVNSLFAMPLTPSVPNNFPIIPPNLKSISYIVSYFIL